MTALTYQLQYNTEREHLIIPEYGRHLQKMIDHAVAQESKEERNRLAKAIISIMGNMQPHLRDVPDFQHKLWDQLFIMSDLKLDADSPFEIPTEEMLNVRPEPLNLTSKRLLLLAMCSPKRTALPSPSIVKCPN